MSHWNNRVYNGDGASMHGDNNVINGDHNNVTGHNTVVNGDSNTIIGNNTVVNGDRNIVYGDNTVLNGDNNTVSGNNVVDNGENNTVNGTRAPSGHGGGRSRSSYSCSIGGVSGITSVTMTDGVIENGVVVSGSGCYINGVRVPVGTSIGSVVHGDQFFGGDAVAAVAAPAATPAPLPAHEAAAAAAAAKCVKCMSAPINMCLQNCGHACMCKKCTKRTGTCPICSVPYAKRETRKISILITETHH